MMETVLKHWWQYNKFDVDYNVKNRSTTSRIDQQDLNVVTNIYEAEIRQGEMTSFQ